MIVVNTETVPGMDIVAVKGIVQGNTIRAKHVGRDIAASLKNLVGGELKGYTELLTEARREAMERMLAQAEQLGANAVVNVRFSTSAVTAGAAEIYAYGTAVTVQPIGGLTMGALHPARHLACSCPALLGLGFGATTERRHLSSLTRREEALADMLVTDLKRFPGGADASAGVLMVTGEAAIATDYLKTFLADLRKLVGGELRSYQSLMLRARREAVLRMLEEARSQGYDAVCNVRLNTSNISGISRKRPPVVEMLATGTAYRRLRDLGDAQALLGPVGAPGAPPAR